MRARELIRLIEADGWELKSARGSHYKYKHPFKSGRVVIPVHGGKDLAIGTLRSILKAAQIETESDNFEEGDEL